MRRLLIILCTLSLLACGQSAQFPTKADLTKIYSQAIADFIKDATQNQEAKFDTLFFGKRENRDVEDKFPDIELPAVIENTQIRLVSEKEGTTLQKERKLRIHINMVGWADDKKAEFLFFVFTNGFEYKYNYTINYTYNAQRKIFELTKLKFKGPPFDQ